MHRRDPTAALPGCIGAGACGGMIGRGGWRPIALRYVRGLGDADTPGQDRTGDLQRVRLASRQARVGEASGQRVAPATRTQGGSNSRP